jgi:hypothetical protein
LKIKQNLPKQENFLAFRAKRETSKRQRKEKRKKKLF